MNETERCYSCIAQLEKIIDELRKGATAQDVQERFHQIVSQAHPEEGDAIRKYLIEEGVPAEEVERWSTVHLFSQNAPYRHPMD